VVLFLSVDRNIRTGNPSLAIFTAESVHQGDGHRRDDNGPCGSA
jgi:hypothetical protein